MTPLPRWVDIGLLPFLNVLLAFFIGGLIVAAVGQDPLQAVGIMVYGAFGYGNGLGYTLYYTTDFIFAGLAVSVAYHAGLFNIGPEGQAYVGGLGVILVALALNGMPWWVVGPLMVVGGALFAGIWAFIPGYLQARRGSHIVITTILFNFIATLFVGYVIDYMLRPKGADSDESAPILAATRIPQLREFLPFFGHSPVNLTVFLAIACLFLIYWLVWRTKLGYAMRALGQNPVAANYAGISNQKMIMLVMVISGALAGMVAVNNVGGVQGRLILNFVNGAGFVGVAVAFMGKAHPIGVALSALLFGALYQGGSELAFSMPGVTKEMILTIQALVILFTGAMGDMLRTPLQRFFAGGEKLMETYVSLIFVLDSTVRLSVPVILACLAGLYSERAGIVDIGLEGKLLVSAFGAAAASAVTGSAWIGLLAGVLSALGFSAIHGIASINFKGNQTISGVALNFLAAGLTTFLGTSWFHQGGFTPQLSGAQRFLPIDLPFAAEIQPIPIIGPLYADLISGHSILVYLAFLAVPATAWLLFRTRFGLRLRAVGENPKAVDTAGISVTRLRYAALVITAVLTGIGGSYLSIAQGAGFVNNMSNGRGYIALAALIFAKWRPWPALWVCLLFAFLDALQLRLQGYKFPLIGEIPVQFIQVLPYLLTIILLAGFIGRAVAPKASGIPYTKER